MAARTGSGLVGWTDHRKHPMQKSLFRVLEFTDSPPDNNASHSSVPGHIVPDIQTLSPSSSPSCDDHSAFSPHASLAAYSVIIEPRTFRETSADPKWVEDIQAEISALKENNTWSIVYLTPEKSNGETERYKAILVTRFYILLEGLDYTETLSPVAKMVTVSVVVALATIEPRTFRETIADPKWVEDIQAEISALEENNTWYKATLVAKGYNQQEGLDYTETFSPVAKMVTVRIIVALVAASSWYIFQMRSVVGNVVKFGIALISWKSKKQGTVSRSSAEAEFRSMAATVAEIVWLVRLFKELGVDVTLHVSLHCNIKAAIQIVAHPIFHKRTKHIDIDCHFLREKIVQGLVQIQHIGTTEQIADVLTKALCKPHHDYLLSKLGMKDVFHPSA
ncbi:uncharacterized protein [Nicotiana tomentosiformis]|uniref:uncharacterized protein n=1 Tax=Nicotiana tomentosiformis TaxID=4098 RepID=UPI00388C5BDC